MNHPNPPLHPKLSTAARPYAAAILAISKENPNVVERAVMVALDLDRVEHRHVAFAGWVRRLAAGEPEESLIAYLEPCKEEDELADAMSVIPWLRSQAAAQTAAAAIQRASLH